MQIEEIEFMQQQKHPNTDRDLYFNTYDHCHVYCVRFKDLRMSYLENKIIIMNTNNYAKKSKIVCVFCAALYKMVKKGEFDL